jgi:hypothetical protein
MTSLRRLTSSLASALALSALAAGVVARGEVITSNIADPADGGSYVYTTFPQRAQAFLTTASGTQVTTLKMDLAAASLTQAFNIKIFSSTASGSSGLPNSAIATVFTGTGGDILLGSSPFTISSLGINLAPSTQYFVVFECLEADNRLQWNFNNETSGSGAGFETFNTYSESSAGNWQGISKAQPYRMEIVAVPEPPAIVLSGIGLASAMYAFRRRRG